MRYVQEYFLYHDTRINTKYVIQDGGRWRRRADPPQGNKDKYKKYENDFIGGPSDLRINQLPTKRDVLRYMRKLIDDNKTKQGYHVIDCEPSLRIDLFHIGKGDHWSKYGAIDS